MLVMVAILIFASLLIYPYAFLTNGNQSRISIYQVFDKRDNIVESYAVYLNSNVWIRRNTIFVIHLPNLIWIYFNIITSCHYFCNRVFWWMAIVTGTFKLFGLVPGKLTIKFSLLNSGFNPLMLGFYKKIKYKLTLKCVWLKCVCRHQNLSLS